MTRKLLQERTPCSPSDKQPLIIVLWEQSAFRAPSLADCSSLTTSDLFLILSWFFFFSSSRVVVFSLRSEGGLTKRAAGMCSLRSSQAWLEDCFPSVEPGWWTGENLSKRAANHRRTIWNKEVAAHFSWFLLDTSPACPGCSSSGGDCQDQSAGFAVTCVTHLSGLRLSVAEIASVCDTH